MKIKADKIASSTRNCRLSNDLLVSDELIAKEGYIIAVKALGEKNTYNTIELVSGRMSRICRGDIIAGVLGSRKALKGYSGIVPEKIKKGDILQLLNLGGVIGTCTSDNPELGPPINVEVLGAVLTFPLLHDRIGLPAHIMDAPIKPIQNLAAQGISPTPLVIISGTCMNAGKTRAACEIIKQLTHHGLKVHAAKLTGISLMRDTLEMADFGAEKVLNFTDGGSVSTTPTNAVQIAKSIVADLSKSKPYCIVLELGDGIMGEYGVMNLLSDKELMAWVAVHILAANDQVGAWGAQTYLKGVCPPIDIITGPATDNEIGKRFVKEKLGIAGANAIKEGIELGALVMQKLNSSIKGEKIIG
ncbi:hypothetical protein HZB02_00110 [Candidatus Woesearchaeota archaeon]|nr:hypothetical protein [Candidatus Woesearchaeota archaeon]